jgi:hypothetical protein
LVRLFRRDVPFNFALRFSIDPVSSQAIRQFLSRVPRAWPGLGRLKAVESNNGFDRQLRKYIDLGLPFSA